LQTNFERTLDISNILCIFCKRMQNLRSCRCQGGGGCPKQRTPDLSLKRESRLVAASGTEAGTARVCGWELGFGRFDTIFAKLLARISGYLRVLAGYPRKINSVMRMQIRKRRRSSKVAERDGLVRLGTLKYAYARLAGGRLKERRLFRWENGPAD